jgi:hypothetical protein
MSKAENFLQTDDVDKAEAWLRSVAALARGKKLKDGGENGNEITDLFLARAGVEAIRRVSIMAAPKTLEDMVFEDIKKLILEQMQPNKRLVIAERTRFLSLRQLEFESVRDYVQRLRSGAILGATGATQSAEDELLLMRLIDGLKDPADRIKIL